VSECVSIFETVHNFLDLKKLKNGKKKNDKPRPSGRASSALLFSSKKKKSFSYLAPI
jgi:hypothetical protein